MDYEFFMKAFRVYQREYLCRSEEEIDRECDRYRECQKYVYELNFD